MISIVAEELEDSKYDITMQLSATKLDKKDFFGKVCVCVREHAVQRVIEVEIGIPGNSYSTSTCTGSGYTVKWVSVVLVPVISGNSTDMINIVLEHMSMVMVCEIMFWLRVYMYILCMYNYYTCTYIRVHTYM